MGSASPVFCERCLASALRRGDFVGLDNLSSYKTVAAEAVVEAARASLSQRMWGTHLCPLGTALVALANEARRRHVSPTLAATSGSGS